MGTLIFGGNIYTLQEEGHKVEAIYIEGSSIVDYGKKALLEEKYQPRIDNTIDLHVDTLLPGFVDSHMHLIGYGEKLLRLDLSECTSQEAALQKVARFAEKIPYGEWVIGDGWNENLWEGKSPFTKKELDAIVPHHPVLLHRICKHAIAVNSKALQLAEVTEQTQVPFGGVIERDEDGVLNGILKDQAQELIKKHLPKATDEYVEKALKTAIKAAYRLGLTGAHTEDLYYYHGYEGTYRTFKKVIEEDGNFFRTHLLVHHEVFSDMVQANGKYLSGGEWVELGAMKIFADGAFGGRTAFLSKPYHDDPTTRGVCIFTQEQLNNLVKSAREKEIPVAVHAIGDAAFEMVLNAMEKHPLQGFGRDRLIHATMLREDLLERVKKLPVILDIQPCFVTSDFPWVIDRLGKDNMKYCYAWKTLLEEGVHCAGGSDAPIESASPLLGIQAAVTRTNKFDVSKKGYQMEEALSVYEAVCLYTKGSAYAICRETERGVIKKGNAADFTVLDRDIFEIEKTEIEKLKVTKTVIGGKVMYECGSIQ
ncbi:amidohydrolase [Niallia sp. 01092]|uniref:amidohydrolase n=1 Tax=unclassified Niallia TaxID=2837522 RepID=UPI003FD0CAEA